MDPFSITTAAVSLAIAIGQVTSSISQFVKEIKEANNDLDLVSQELSSLINILNIISGNDATTFLQDFPTNLRCQLEEVIQGCGRAIKDINKLLKKHQSGMLAPLRWAQSGSAEANSIRTRLEVYKSTLNIVLGFLSL
jgi:hypothetical protein